MKKECKIRPPPALVNFCWVILTGDLMVDHLLGIQGLHKEEIYRYLDTAHSFVEVSERAIKKVPTLRGRTIVNVFFEPSTRTLASFDVAGKRLSADTINLSAGSSSVKKGETLLDTVRTLESMNPDILVIRHSESGAPRFVAKASQDKQLSSTLETDNMSILLRRS